MAAIASFHLVRDHPGRQLAVMARLGTDRLRLRGVGGLRFWRLLGTGAGADTGPGADLRRSALFAVWDDESDLDRFVAEHPIARRWTTAEEAWGVRLRGVGGHGAWRGEAVLDLIEPGRADGPVAIITRADVRVGAWRTFRSLGPTVDEELQTAEGLLAVAGIGEAPLLRLGTFSLWRSLADARYYATQLPIHRDVVRRTRTERWYGEELFARFEPYASTGTWDGVDPLAR